MQLNERKLKILKAVIKDYIETAEAVGSRTISKKYDLGVGAATIRNEMADLEDLGYLIQPYTSAGRIPTELGYKLYVDSLMNQDDLNDFEKELINTCINQNVVYIKDLIHETSKLLSRLTNYTTIAVTKSVANQVAIKYIQLVALNEENILLIVVTDKGDVKKVNLTANAAIDQHKLNLISNDITKKLEGKKITDIDDQFINYIKYEISENSIFIDDVLNSLNNKINKSESDISLSGATNIFNYPEFSDSIRAKSFLNMLEEEDSIKSMLASKGIEKDNVKIVIGSDNECETAKDCSVITATYNIDKDLVGRISFIGPTRMDYSKIYSIINYIGLLLNQNKNILIKNNIDDK